MKNKKSDITLNEKDAILDMLDSEKQLMSLYTTAIFEGSTKSLRKEFSSNLLAVASDQYNLFLQMQSRGYAQPAPAQKQMIDQTNETFKKEKKNLQA